MRNFSYRSTRWLFGKSFNDDDETAEDNGMVGVSADKKITEQSNLLATIIHLR